MSPPDAPVPGPPPALVARFLDRLGERLRRFAELERNPAPESRDEMRQLAHALAGTSGTFGFPRLGDRARALERLLEEFTDPRKLADAVHDLLVEGEQARQRRLEEGR